MRNLHKWLLALGVATVLFGAIMFTQHSAKVNEQKLKSQMQKLEAQTKSQHDAEVENLKKQIKDLDTKLQSKAAEKAAADAIAKAKAIVTPIPTAQASQVPQNAPGDVQSIIVKWANHYGVSAQHMLNIARCESTFNPNARNPSYSAGAAGNPVGLFQHVEGYWPARAAKYGVPGASIYDADAQARVTAAMFADGQAHLWECR